MPDETITAMTAPALDTETLGRAAAVRTARRLLEPGAAIILDTETTGLEGHTVEIAVLDTAGHELLNTLVRPPTPIELEAQLVHGIAMTDLSAAPSWSQILPRLLRITAGRTIIAYNAPFDAAVLARDSAAAGLSLEHLADTRTWQCLMQLRTEWDGTGERTRLTGTHRAAGDCRAALELLHQIAAGGR